MNCFMHWDHEIFKTHEPISSDFPIYVAKFNKVFFLFTKVSQVSGKIRHSPSFSIDLFRLPPLNSGSIWQSLLWYYLCFQFSWLLLFVSVLECTKEWNHPSCEFTKHTWVNHHVWFCTSVHTTHKKSLLVESATWILSYAVRRYKSLNILYGNVIKNCKDQPCGLFSCCLWELLCIGVKYSTPLFYI